MGLGCAGALPAEIAPRRQCFLTPENSDESRSICCLKIRQPQPEMPEIRAISTFDCKDGNALLVIREPAL
jgi:hypothetical protein